MEEILLLAAILFSIGMVLYTWVAPFVMYRSLRRWAPSARFQYTIAELWLFLGCLMPVSFLLLQSIFRFPGTSNHQAVTIVFLLVVLLMQAQGILAAKITNLRRNLEGRVSRVPPWLHLLWGGIRPVMTAAGPWGFALAYLVYFFEYR